MSWNDLTNDEKLIFKDYCERKFGQPSSFLGKFKEPLYIDDDLNLIDDLKNL